MGNAILAWPDYVLADPAFAVVRLSGGSWTPELPLSNLLNGRFAYPARSNDVAPSSTRFWVDLGVARGVAGVFVPLCNGGTACQYRVRGFAAQDETGVPVADTGWSNLYPVTYEAGSLYWGHPSLWDGIMGPEDAAEYPMPVVEVFEPPAVAQYWLIEFLDPGNPAGYFQVSRILITAGWQPALNMSWQASLAVEDQAVVQEALSGAFYYEARPIRRVARFTLAFLQRNEAMTWAHDIQRRLGVTGQLYFVWDPDDRPNMHRRSFLCRMRTLSPLESISYNNNSAPFELQEVIA